MAWRTPLALQLIFIIFLGITINFFPEYAENPPPQTVLFLTLLGHLDGS